ncbi:D-alanyl-D-alanine carboxypeptidase family protein [Parasphingopyxis lamellibrachiae]|uniref:serine-type D-Ala-D-Ala carboxypeptidase n=1 Tax=Parasphingopyxis lamellibrachiae TaxID=680125 RepID=A0A3D9FCQ9_9SPHN|nr:D-alanyl-D-alanine carboxypeptidase family protein [Parasphingopyxis lamellibrachiae]RED15585.1 D-alanyl-D-alanine carboxypeptidase (penicillin-binding protein 5/6) [Parasphingopyxis lamellibrachiae]
MKKATVLLALTAGALVAPGHAERPRYDGDVPIAYMVDMSSGAILFARDGNRRIPPASMAKMMTAHVAFDLLQEGTITLDQECTVRPETWRQWHGPEAGSTMFLSPGEQVSIENLLYGVVTVSGNDASVVLAECISGTESAFTALMNRKAEELGLENSHFGNSNGWPDEGRTYVTARDLARLAISTIQHYPEYYSQFYGRREFTWGETMGGQPITQPNRNPLMGNVDGADGLKTGHTQEAGYGFTGSAVQDGRRIVMVLAGLDSYSQRIEQSTRFMEWGFNAWQSLQLLTSGARVGSARVQGGSSGEVGLVAPRNLAMTVPAGLASERQVRIVYQGPVRAPIAEGQHIADLVIETPDMPDQRLPLVAETAVGERGFFGRVWAGLKSLIGLG